MILHYVRMAEVGRGQDQNRVIWSVEAMALLLQEQESQTASMSIIGLD
jgi:hypothetical protein